MAGLRLSRRALLKRTLTAGASVVLFRWLLQTEAGADERPPGPATGRPHRWGMVIDLDKCTGCQACVVACFAENNQPLPSPGAHREGRVIEWMKLLPFQEGEYPYVRQRLLPIPCQHCDRPPCTPVCPVSATYKNPEGLVAQIYPRCIGCRYCVNACPYTCKFFNWSQAEWPAPMGQMLNPDVSLRPKGVVEKCTFCHHRLQRARELVQSERRPLREGDYVPACMQACPAQAITFGDLNDPDGPIAQAARSPRAFALLEDLGTLPKVIYLREG